MISKRDSKPILVKFAIGTSEEDSREKIYQDNWDLVYGLIRDPSGSLATNEYGQEEDFDRVITLNAGVKTRLIDYDTAILIDEMPSNLFAKGDYSVKYIYPEYNNEIVIGLSRKEAVKFPRLYFYNNGKLLYTQMNFDKNTNKAYVNKRQVIPFVAGSYVWTREPSSDEDTAYRLYVSSIVKSGLDSQVKSFKTINFLEI